MDLRKKPVYLISVLLLLAYTCECAKINTPRVLLPWFQNLVVNFTFEIIEGGCYTWSLSRDDIIDLQPLYEHTWGDCSRAARVFVSKTCKPPGSVIIFAEEVNSGEIIRGDVDINKIKSLKVMSTTWKLYLEEAPEAFEVVAYDNDGNKFSTLEGVTFEWTIDNVVQNGEAGDALLKLMRWRDTDYEAPRGVAELENINRNSYSVLLYGQAMGEAHVTVCLDTICTDFNLHVVASVVLTPATAIIAPGDTLRYRVVRARAGRLTVQEVADTLYNIVLPDENIALLEDSVSLIRGTNIGSTSVLLMSGSTDVATAALTVAEPHSIKVTLRPPDIIAIATLFSIHCIVLDAEGRALTAGDQILIRLRIEGDSKVDMISSSKNRTVTYATAQTLGRFTVTAELHSVAGRTLYRTVQGQTSAIVVDNLSIVPSEIFISWMNSIQEITLKHTDCAGEPVVWSLVDGEEEHESLSLSPSGVVVIRGVGGIAIKVQLKKYPHIYAVGSVISALPEFLRVSSSGQARAGRPHQLQVALTATHPITGELYNFHRCNCDSFAVTLLDGPEPSNIAAAPWITPVDGACCVLEGVWGARGVAILRVSGARVADTCRVLVRAAPHLVWPPHAAALVHATQPVLALGEALVPHSNDPRVAELTSRDGPPPHRHPDLQLFTLKCRKKGDTILKLTSKSGEEEESVELEVSCASHVTRIRLEPPESPGNCSGGPRVWLRPGHEVKVRVTLLDAIGRELLDERGPKVHWEVNPINRAIEYRALDRLFMETHPEYVPVAVPFKYYQVVIADDKAIGWSGSVTANIPDATASLQARVVAPLKCDILQENIAWEGENVPNIADVSGGSGRYYVEGPKGVGASVDNGKLTAVLPGPGTYNFLITDMCIANEKQFIEVHVEEVATVEVATSRAVSVGGCVPLAALVRGPSARYLGTSSAPEWTLSGALEVRGGALCGLREGVGKVRATLAHVRSEEVEVIVFPPLSVVPDRARLPAGGRLQLQHEGGPPPHLATLHYDIVDGGQYAEVSPSGLLLGLSIGSARVRLVARDVANVEMSSADAVLEIVPISGLKVRSATHTLLVGAPCPLWLESEGLGPSVLSGLQPAPRVTWSLREPLSARLITTHVDDLLERSIAEGLAIRVIPLKAGLITVDVRVRNMIKSSESRTWDSTVEILAVSELRTAVEGAPEEMRSGDRLALAVGGHLRLRSAPRGHWRAYGQDVLELTPAGELRGLTPGHGVVVAEHNDQRNHIYRETAVHVEVSIPHYCTVEPSGEEDESAVRVVLRNNIGRELIAPEALITATPHLAMHLRRNVFSSLGNELVLTGLESAGRFMTFHSTVSGVTVRDEVWVTGSDLQADRVVVSGGWVVCLEGGSWRAPPAVTLHEGAGVTLAVLSKDGSAKHTLKADRPPRSFTIHQLPITKIEFQPGEWPSSMVPINIEGSGLTSGPVLCSEEQLIALQGIHVELPFTCRTQAPHTAEPILDLNTGNMGCSIVAANVITTASEVELCVEWGGSRACTRVLMLPLITLQHNKISLLKQPGTFKIYGHPHALKLVKITTSPGLKMEINNKVEGETSVSLTSEVSTCGMGWVNVRSRVTAQELRVEVDRECEVACGSLLGSVFSLLAPFLPTIATCAVLIGASAYVYSRIMQKAAIRVPTAPPPTMIMAQTDTSPPLNRSRTWSRSPYASNGPAAPVYGDASSLPENRYSPNSTRAHSRLL